jgi:hypothetical protein
MKFVIFSCGYNCDAYAKYNMLSIHNQNYDNYVHVIIDDATPEPMKLKSFNDKQIIHRNETNQKWIANALQYLPLYAKPDDVIIALDLDDHLVNNTVLSKVSQYYNIFDCWMTYSLFRYWPGIQTSNWIPKYDDKTLSERSFRQHIWSWTHLRTFKYGLFKHIQDEDLQFNGQYVKYTYDQTIGFPMLEMAGKDKISFISEILCNYNSINPYQVEKINKKAQQEIGKYVRSKPKYNLLTEL